MEDNPKLNQTDARDLIAQAMSGVGQSPEVFEAIQISGIELIEKVGRGGMGEVYMGLVAEDDSVVAVKVLNPVEDGDPLGTERFIREGETLNRLNHSNLLKIRDRGYLADGRPFFVTDYMEGGTLDELIKQGEQLDEARINSLLTDLCAGLSVVHEAGMVHRDIKPSNLLLNSDGHLVIGDFGLAKTIQVEETELTLSGTTLGTASYMAPEQSLPDTTIDASADIFSIGVVLYQLLTGVLPKGQFKPPSAFARSKYWDGIVARCLAPLPEERYQNAADLGKAVQKVIQSPNKSRRSLLVGGGVLATAGVVGAFVKNSNPTAEEWEDLLPGFTLSSSWFRDDQGQLISSGELKGATCFSSVSLPDRYEVRGVWNRQNGTASLAIFLPTSAGPIIFEMGAWHQDLVGFQTVDGKSLRDEGGLGERIPISNGVEYRFYVSISPDELKYQFDDGEIRTFPIDGESFVRGEMWTDSSASAFGVGSWKSRAVFSVLEVRRG